MESTGSLHGVLMESMWTIGNAGCSPAKIHGVSTKSSWSLWECVGECKVLPPLPIEFTLNSIT